MAISKESVFFLSSLIVAAWNDLLKASNDIDVHLQNKALYVPLKMQIECKVQMNPGLNAPAVFALGVPMESEPVIKVEIFDCFKEIK
jgi:hypothetical protein